MHIYALSRLCYLGTLLWWSAQGARITAIFHFWDANQAPTIRANDQAACSNRPVLCSGVDISRRLDGRTYTPMMPSTPAPHVAARNAAGNPGLPAARASGRER